MIISKELLTKATKKGSQKAATILHELSQLAGLTPPLFEFSVSGHGKKPRHFCKVRFRVPDIIDTQTRVIWGSGKCKSKQNAKMYASHEVVLKLEDELKVKRNGIPQYLATLQEQQKEAQAVFEAVPVEESIPDVTWDSFPSDPQFQEPNRRGRFDFIPDLVQDKKAFDTAKMLTLLPQMSGLPEIAFHNQSTDTGALLKFCNIKLPGFKRVNLGVSGTPRSMDVHNRPDDRSEVEALQYTLFKLSKLAKSMARLGTAKTLLQDNPSFGMAKLFVTWPKHHLDQLKETISKVEASLSPQLLSSNQRKHSSHRKRKRKIPANNLERLEVERLDRLDYFRSYQSANPLPIDQVESDIPWDATITVLKGGTGSGKTTRYPLLLSLLSIEETPKILVAQPRRLACQTAARHVASELVGSKVGTSHCPIGYMIRFESKPAQGERTIDYCTPGVLLRRATEDPLLQDVTHLVIDEVHIRNADTDLLLSLAKQAVRKRANTDSPLKVVLMSATLESSLWEGYFGDCVAAKHIAAVSVPDFRRFPIDIVHRGDKGFPKLEYVNPNQCYLNDDEALCQMTAELALKLARQQEQQKENGSILCFLPGMEEIQMVHRYLRGMSGRNKLSYRVQYLHSSLSSQQQARVFEEGLKIILSTNIAETSLTIPDVKAVIDTGRERQHSLLEQVTKNSFTTVVGSQLATVNISKAAAKQRAGRAGRVSAGTCYRLYTEQEFETVLDEYDTPEMLRMELSQLVLHSLSLYHPSAEHPLQLLKEAPDTPDSARMEQTLRGLAAQGLVVYQGAKQIELTPLGEAVSNIPTSPRLGRMLMMGLLLQSIEPAITVASLLSVPKVFMDRHNEKKHSSHSSDVIRCLENYKDFCSMDWQERKDHPQFLVFRQVQRVESQLESHMKCFLAGSVSKSNGEAQQSNNQWEEWNANSDRVGAVVSLICCATPHIAHLVEGKNGFATRDIAGYAKMHPSSVNFDMSRRVHWYTYNELRATKHPYLHVTTAVSPLEVSVFSEASSGFEATMNDRKRWDSDSELESEGDVSDRDEVSLSSHGRIPVTLVSGRKNWLFVVDQWVPVDLTNSSQRETFVKLRNLLMHDLPQQVSVTPSAYLSDSEAKHLVLLILSAIEQQRVKK